MASPDHEPKARRGKEGSNGGPPGPALGPGTYPLGSGTATRERILWATVELIAEVGWGGVTTRLVAKRSGANSALVHYYFGSKNALLTAAATAALTGEFQHAVDVVVRADSLVAGLVAVFEEFRQYEPATPQGRLIIEVMAQSVRDPLLRQAMVQLLRDTRARLAVRAEAELPEDVDPAGVGILLAALLDGIGLHMMLDPELDLARAAEALTSIALRGKHDADT